MSIAFASAVTLRNPLVHRHWVTTRISTLPKYRHATRQPQRHLFYASTRKPPAVKSSFYKNPSKAIEKGGGFYIPGLRGPRLRVFVASVALSLLTINHVVSLRVGTAAALSFTVSELVAIFAATCVGASAFLDIKSDEIESGSESREDQIAEKSTATPVPGQIGYVIGNTVEEVMEWTARVSMQMTGLDGFYVFQDESLVFSRGELTAQQERGPAVARVASENKAIYIDDTSRLPPEVRFPFLQGSTNNGWRIFMVPIVNGRAVVVFSGKLGSEKQDISPRDRNWLTECSGRIDEVWS